MSGPQRDRDRAEVGVEGRRVRDLLAGRAAEADLVPELLDLDADDAGAEAVERLVRRRQLVVRAVLGDGLGERQRLWRLRLSSSAGDFERDRGGQGMATVGAG